MTQPVISGIGKLGLMTTDGSGPGGLEGGYFPFTTSVTFTKKTSNQKIFAYPPAGGTGRLKQISLIQDQEDWSASMVLGTQSWLDLQLMYGQHSQSVTQSYFDVKTALVTSGVVNDTDLTGLTVNDVVVSYTGYSSTAGAPIQLAVQIAPHTPLQGEVVLDPTAHTLTFHSSMEGQSIYYAINKSSTKDVIGRANPQLIRGFKFFGVLATPSATTAAGYGIYIPSLVLDGNFSFGAGAGSKNATVDIPFTPLLYGNNSEPVLTIKL